MGWFSDFRPVSNVPFVSKVEEKVVSARLQHHMADHNLYEPMQSAYRRGHSTETALVRVSNDILCAMDRQEVVILVLLDLSSAFDTIDHTILIQRLHDRLGIRDWTVNYYYYYTFGSPFCSRK